MYDSIIEDLIERFNEEQLWSTGPFFFLACNEPSLSVSDALHIIVVCRNLKAAERLEGVSRETY